MLRIQDIMTRDVLCIAPATSLDEAATMLAESRVGGAPVVDGKRVIGVLSKTNLINLAPGAGERRAADAMTPLIIYVRPEEPAVAAVTKMLAERVHRVLVLGEGGSLEGIVTATDVLQAIERGDGDLAPRHSNVTSPPRNARAGQSQAIPDGVEE